MKKLVLIFAILLSAAICAQAQPDRILMVLTSHSKLGDTGKSTGFYLTEVTHPYEVFKKAGYEVDFVSPKGGHPPIDGLDSADEESKKLLDKPEFRNALARSKKPSQIDIGDYKAIFFAGGHGTMWDFPNHKRLQALTSEIYEDGGVVAAVCHGPVALVNVKLSDGTYLVANQPVAAFTNEEEEAVGLTEVMPFLLESKLRERGAKIQKAPNFEKNVAVGERLVTGQNPASASGVAEEIVKLLTR